MPDNHRQYLEHTPDHVRDWAKTIGINTEKFVEYILENNVEKKALSILASLKNLSKRYSNELIEEGCETLISVSRVPTLSVLKSILKRIKDRQKSKEKGTLNEIKTNADYGFTRGANYFGGIKNEK